MTDDVILMRQGHDPSPFGPERDVLFFDQPLLPERLAQVTTAQLWAPHDEKIARLPKVIGEMTNLISLTISGGSSEPSLVSDLQTGDLPESLEELRILDEYGRVVTWPDVQLPRLKTLFVSDVFRFNASAFPQLHSLSLKPDRAQTNLRQALRLPIDELNVLNVSLDESIFEIISDRPLRLLGLLSGTKLTSLEGIQALPALESLRLKNLRALSDISALRDLPNLTQLDIQYCRRIRGIGVLADLTSLERLTLVGCGDLGLSELKDVIDRIPRSTIGATT
ncbi:leucine-rich repeat domain-containing protein [Microbacterium sp. CIAB417]|uniref:leucine-rich repeat domain-containing protein n=1 Tax=Microbacterium sp. CIAB417 TaxID=2860287 RepID=UPI001FACD100|nr:leucine-rich repeat domain-containing protein [Microbacterium sp. CIAB417]